MPSIYSALFVSINRKNNIIDMFPERLNKRAVFLLMALSDVTGIDDLKKICEPPSLKLHKLKGSMKEYWSITIEKPWCIISKYSKGEFINVQIGDYHD